MVNCQLARIQCTSLSLSLSLSIILKRSSRCLNYLFDSVRRNNPVWSLAVLYCNFILFDFQYCHLTLLPWAVFRCREFSREQPIRSMNNLLISCAPMLFSLITRLAGQSYSVGIGMQSPQHAVLNMHITILGFINKCRYLKRGKINIAQHQLRKCFIAHHRLSYLKAINYSLIKRM